MSQTTQEERIFSYLYFKNKEVNGKPVAGKFDTLKVRFLYASVEQIPMGRVHLYNYAPKKFARTLCLQNGVNNKQLKEENCPMCAKETYGTPANKYYAFVSDENDEGKLKLLEFNWSLGKQMDEIAEIKGRPLHDLVFTLSKKGIGKETTYTPLLEETSKFSVRDFLALSGLSDYPALVGAVGDRAPIMLLDKQQMVDFIGGKYPWSNGEGSNQRKFTVLGTSVTVRNEHTQATNPTEATEVADLTADVDTDSFEYDDSPKETDFF